MQPDKRQTLIVLSPGFPKNEADTSCLPLQQSLLNTIKKNYPELNLVVLAFQYPFDAGNYDWNGVPVQAFGGKSRGKLLRLYNWVKVWKALKRINETEPVAGILSFWLGECAFIGQRFANRYKLKYRCWILGQDARPGNRYFKKVNPCGRSLIALSDQVARSIYINYGIMPRHIIPGGVDPILFNGNAVARDIDILGAGSLIPLKQYHLFIEVVSRLRHKYPYIKVVLCGAGPDSKRLEQMIKQLKLQENITLTGELPHRQVLALIQRSKVLLHPSAYEGLGMVCLEALCAGAKVVSMVKPMDNAIPNWYIAQNTMHITQITDEIIGEKHPLYRSVIPYHINDIAAQMVALYLDKPAAIALKRPAMALKESVLL
jgi:glycosyltransferase involved in cell wall biosynthesis